MNNISSPRSDDAGLEARLAAAATAPRVSLQDLRDKIASCYFFTAAEAAFDKLWPLLGFQLKDRLYQESLIVANLAKVRDDAHADE